MRRVNTFLLYAAAAALFQIATAPNAFATPILGSNLSTFAILGGAGVMINGTGSVITGNVGACCVATAITGAAGATVSGGTVLDAVAAPPTDPRALAQAYLGYAITALSNMTVTDTTAVVGGGQSLAPGVYSSSTTMDLTGALTLDGGGNANALWVFEIGSAVTFAAGSVVNLTNTGPNAGVYWVMKNPTASAVLTSTVSNPTTVVGNFLSNINATLAPGVTNSCGGFYTQTASVTLAGADTIGIGCAGGGTITTSSTLPGGLVVTALPNVPVPVPEPGTWLLLGTGIAGLVVARRRRSARGRQLVLAPMA